MGLYGQEPEAHLLAAFVSWLDDRSMIDVGAEHGGFVAPMLEAGIRNVYAVEPEPGNATVLRRQFQDESRVTVLEYAISDVDTPLDLHRSVDPTGAPVSFGHTLLERSATDEIAWGETVSVTGRSLASLVQSGETPKKVGIVKVDTEGHDLAVVRGMGDLECDVVMVEHWSDLPHSLGTCPWTTDEMVSALEPRGFSHFAGIFHRGEFVILSWDDGQVPPGAIGNLVFLHDRVISRALPDLLASASRLAAGAVEVGEMYATAANERLALIEDLERQCELQIRALEELAESRKSLLESRPSLSGQP